MYEQTGVMGEFLFGLFSLQPQDQLKTVVYCYSSPSASMTVFWANYSTGVLFHTLHRLRPADINDILFLT